MMLPDQEYVCIGKVDANVALDEGGESLGFSSLCGCE